MLNQRQKDILKAVVLEFLKDGQPISSLRLYKNYDLGIKPAMIRKELESLKDKGYLTQPYYSSGRIPSDLAYNFIIKNFIENNNEAVVDKFLINLLKRMELQEAAYYLANKLNILSVVIDLIKKDFIYRSGLEYLIEDVGWIDTDELKNIIKNIEYLNKKVDDLNKIFKNKNFIKIFVGKNPFIKNDSLSIIMADYFLNNRRILVAAIGSKRINYEKIYCIFKGLKQYLK